MFELTESNIDSFYNRIGTFKGLNKRTLYNPVYICIVTFEFITVEIFSSIIPIVLY